MRPLCVPDFCWRWSADRTTPRPEKIINKKKNIVFRLLSLWSTDSIRQFFFGDQAEFTLFRIFYSCKALIMIIKINRSSPAHNTYLFGPKAVLNRRQSADINWRNYAAGPLYHQSISHDGRAGSCDNEKGILIHTPWRCTQPNTDKR